MMKRAIAVLSLLLGVLLTHGQEISRHEADAMLKSLKAPNTSDTFRLQTLLALTSFNILKPGELKADLDSAEVFLNQAYQLNGKIQSPEANGNLQLLAA